MKYLKHFVAALAAALITAAPLAACNVNKSGQQEEQKVQDSTQLETPEFEEEQLPPAIEQPEEENEQQPVEDDKPQTVAYISVTAQGVNIRSGAGTGYSVRGQAEKSTLYCLSSTTEGWYGTGYRNKDGYISSKYCTVVNMPSSEDERIESVIAQGCRLLGTPYVYGAVRLHDGRGNFYKSFTTDEFDCSSLMQYIFYKGAGVLLDVNTRTQVYQGTTVTRQQLKRGDLMFFTNASRKNNKGVEKIGHVALYLGDNYILHTASDYAKIEQISATRWSYFIQGQRIL